MLDYEISENLIFCLLAMKVCVGKKSPDQRYSQVVYLVNGYLVVPKSSHHSQKRAWRAARWSENIWFTSDTAINTRAHARGDWEYDLNISLQNTRTVSQRSCENFIKKKHKRRPNWNSSTSTLLSSGGSAQPKTLNFQDNKLAQNMCSPRIAHQSATSNNPLSPWMPPIMTCHST